MTKTLDNPDNGLPPQDDNDTPEVLGGAKGPKRATTRKQNTISYVEKTGYNLRHADGPLPGKPLPVGPVGGVEAQGARNRDPKDLIKNAASISAQKPVAHDQRPADPRYGKDSSHIGILVRAMKLGDDWGENARNAEALGRYMQTERTVLETYNPVHHDAMEDLMTAKDESTWVRGKLDPKSLRFLKAFCAGNDPAELVSPGIVDRNSRTMSGNAELRVILRALAKAQAEFDNLVHNPLLPSEWNLEMQQWAVRFHSRAL
jgi:hypothetical protein